MAFVELPLEAPPRRALVQEATAGLELARLAWRAPEVLRAPRGDGAPVVVLPGYATGDVSTALLRAVLRALGWDARGWGLGINRGDVDDVVPRVEHRLAQVVDGHGAPVRLVGWSLGGVLAREVARGAPHLVDRVVTLGTPVVGGPKYTTVAHRYRARGVDLDELERKVAAADAVPLTVPVTAVYSRADGVVAPAACIDRRNAVVEHVEVRASHFAMGVSPEVLVVVAGALARR